MPWWIWVIIVAVLAFGFFMNHMAIEIIEDEHLFLVIAMIFFVIYIGAAALVAQFMPTIPGTSSVASLMHFFTFNQI